MAAPKKTKGLFLYDCTWPTLDKAAIEMECIRRDGYWELNGKRYGMGLAHHVMAFAKIVWPWYQWHRWAVMHLEELCRPRHRLAVFGPASCVHGSTIIHDPVRNVSASIRDWCEAGIRPYVMTLSGPVLASVPFWKGRADLYEVTLSDGHRFRATSDHRVLLANGSYAQVKSLTSGSLLHGYDASHPQTISDNGQLVRASSAHHLKRIVQGSQSDCPACSCFCGEQPLSEEDTYQGVVPSPAGALTRKECTSYGKDGLEQGRKRNRPCPQIYLLSSCSASHRLSSSRTFSSRHSCEGTHVSEFGRFQSSSGCPSMMRLVQPSTEPTHDSVHTCYPDEYFLSSIPYNRTVKHTVQVSRVRWSEYGDFYDIQVPDEHHYFAEGAIHHNSGKSCLTAMAYLIFYFARPNQTTVLVSSTTREELELRIWGEMKMFWREAKEHLSWIPGHLTDSKQIISTDGKETEFGRDVRNGVVGRPCRIGNRWVVGSGTSPYVGIKNDYVYVAADELGILPPGIIEALANLTSNPQCCFSGLGNLGDLETPLGQICEPAQGWDSLPDSDKSRVYDTRWSNGRAIQFVGMDSPNLDYPAEAEPFPKIIGRRYIEQCARDYGRDTPFFNMFASGKIPRSTMENRVITKQICMQRHAFEEVTWGHEPLTKLYAADISYTGEHGDRTVGIPMAFGKDNEGKMRLAALERPLVYTPNDRSTGTIEEQIAAQMMAECKRLSIPPTHVFFDGTGRSSFTAALMRLWSTEVNPIEFGGSATNRPNFIGRRYEEDDGFRKKKGDLLPCDEVFGKMVSELWFAFRYLIEAEQCRNLSEEVAKEAYLRLWRLTGANKMDVEPKKEMKLRLGRSPDLADCIVVGCEGARRLGFPLGAVGSEQKRRSVWLSRLNQEYKEAQSASELCLS